MPKISTEIKNQIAALPKSELEKVVIKMAGKDKAILDYLLVNYFEKETAEINLFDDAKTDLYVLFTKSYKGYAEQLKLANMLSACIQRINQFTKICKSKNLEADLIMYVLEFVFSFSEKLFGTCFTAFDYKVGLLVKRIISLVQTKMHPDYKIEYTKKINNYLTVLHRESTHREGLPQSI